jgi:hypothetical protein
MSVFARHDCGSLRVCGGAGGDAAVPTGRDEAVNGRKLVAKPVGMAAGAAGGAAFRSLWRRADRGRDVPRAEDDSRSWRAVLLAAALQGAVFAVIHAVIDRATARSQPPAEDSAQQED